MVCVARQTAGAGLAGVSRRGARRRPALLVGVWRRGGEGSELVGFGRSSARGVARCRAQRPPRTTTALRPPSLRSEAYPDLKADRAFRDLQRQLVETEDRIAAARHLYNIEVAAYERRRQAAPSNVIATLFSMQPRSMFEIRDPAAAHRPIVTL